MKTFQQYLKEHGYPRPEYSFSPGDRVQVNGRSGEVVSVMPGNGSIPWYYVQFEDGSEGRFTAEELQ